MDIEFVVAEAPIPPKSAHALVVFEGQTLAGAAGAMDEATGGALTRALAAARFTGAKGQVLDLPAPPKVKAARLLLVGGRKAEAFGDVGAEHAAAAAYNAVKASGLGTLRVEAPEPA